MAAEALRTDQRISRWGWPLIAARLTVLLTWLIGCLLLHHLVALFSTSSPIPRLFLRGAGMIAGLRVRTHGKRTDERTFLLSNHVSWLDIPALAGSTGTAGKIATEAGKGIGMQFPSLLNTSVTAVNFVLKRLIGKMDDKLAIQLATELASPASAANAIQGAMVKRGSQEINNQFARNALRPVTMGGINALAGQD